ncbi:MAG: PD-(D/E)XK nuclease-like domain-containing protein, partial [Helicobacteraceae bacterium]|nr:PD-(D/E)XK nuclease-like domain-containing protein [Helicobacteraceae bacterium]
KLSHDASPDGFTKSAANLGYYVQAAWYMDVCRSVGFEPKEFVFCAVEPNPPYMTGIYELDYSWLEFGRSEYRRALEIFDRLEYYQVPVFKDSRTGEILQTLSPPSWLFYRRNASY